MVTGLIMAIITSYKRSFRRVKNQANVTPVEEIDPIKEIDASIASNPPIDWVLIPLIPIQVQEREHTDLKHHLTVAQMEADPRLRQLMMDNQKELVAPTSPTKAGDPRLIKAKTARGPMMHRVSFDETFKVADMDIWRIGDTEVWIRRKKE